MTQELAILEGPLTNNRWPKLGNNRVHRYDQGGYGLVCTHVSLPKSVALPVVGELTVKRFKAIPGSLYTVIEYAQRPRMTTAKMSWTNRKAMKPLG